MFLSETRKKEDITLIITLKDGSKIEYAEPKMAFDIARDIRELASSSSRPDETNEARIFSLGLGYVSNLFAFDYAFSYLAESLGYEHRLGLRVEF